MWSERRLLCKLVRVSSSVQQRRCLSSRTPRSILAADMLGNFEVQSHSKVHALLRRAIPEHKLPDLRPPNVYGGETLTNALLAAGRILTPSRQQQPSSLTLEFLRPGNYQNPMEFSATKMHESHRFMQASVFVKQNEKCLALANVSFHFDEQGPDTLQYDPPFPEEAHLPEQVPFMEDWAEEHSKRDSQAFPPSTQVRLFLGKMLGVQIKALDPITYLIMNKTPVIRNRFWLRADPDDIIPALPSLGELWSAGLLAYFSDFCLLAPALTQRPGFRVGRIVSLNHSMWFFSNRTMTSPTEWILCELSLVHSGNNTVLCESYMWSENQKRLLAVSKQQGLIRPHKKAHKPTH